MRYAGRPPSNHMQEPAGYKVQQQLGNNGGGMNNGIEIVSRDRQGYIKKNLDDKEVKKGYAKREVDFLRQLKGHPHIVKMVDWYIDWNKERAGIYMEYCSMGSMEQLILRHRAHNMRMINERDITLWFYQLADALAYCHYGPNPYSARALEQWNTVYHRDLKPGNVFLTKETEGPLKDIVIAKLADFGCSSSRNLIRAGVSVPTSQSANTPDFVHPELPKFRRESDIWLLGALIICLCRLEHNPKRYQNDRYRPLGDYSVDLNKVVVKCMDRNWENRPNAVELRGLVSRLYTETKWKDKIECIFPSKANFS